MKNTRLVSLLCLFVVTSCFGSTTPRDKVNISNNAALRYYAAFAEMRDFSLANDKAKELNGVVDGTVPYDDSKFHDLVEKNKSALELMARGTEVASCDWGLDYDLGEDMPVDYVRNALALGRLNVLYVAHLQTTHDTTGTVTALVAGLHFSRDVANGGSLFATIVAKDLLAQHLRMVRNVFQGNSLSEAQKINLKKAVATLGAEGLDWRSATQRELEVLRTHFANDSAASPALVRITSSYIATVNEHGKLPVLQQELAGAPRQLSEVVPHPDRLIHEQEDLTEMIRETRTMLQ